MKVNIEKIAQCDKLREVIGRLESDQSLSQEIRSRCLDPFTAINFQHQTNGEKPNIIMNGMINAFYNGVALALGISNQSMIEN